mmetsp:Transcript_8143/g.19240  ORF Transcript_8143/g.19240 Transcript_8143/m.19240 type:complete len:178 (+) Transcript_8143:68-601(+)|eukprot:CAMPEP_0185802158 /NCGR_PEP_ID=MMETSP1322-20130828/1851_1 /TAXON_ID=265543 /ORGANISM="Minutocellus polymorphus, Strain RCC2270" /LENGTH=177 /DNA_ID=CAMNT_0028497909 /DNA_START=67 /DNA_END=600 /DNA_ORIENTATION=+
MGRRAKKAPVQTKKRHTLAKRFKCPFCTVEDVVECKMDQRKGIGSLACRLCGASFQMPVHHLHEPIDVFSEWLDECEAVKSGGGAGGGDGGGTAGTTGGGGMIGSRGTAIGGVGMYDDSDDELPEASGLHAAAAPAPAAPEPSAVAAAPAASAAPAAGGGAEKASFSTLGLDDSDSD